MSVILLTTCSALVTPCRRAFREVRYTKPKSYLLVDRHTARSDGIFICAIQRGAQKKCERGTSKAQTIFHVRYYTKFQFRRRVVSKRNQVRRSVSSVQTSIRLAVATSRCSSHTLCASRKRAANVLLSSANSASMANGSTYSASLSSTR